MRDRGRPVRAVRPGQRERGPARGRDRPRRERDPDDPHEPALQRLDPAASRSGRDAPPRPVAGEPARVGRPLGAGRGRPPRQDPRRGPATPGPASTCSAACSSASAGGASGPTAVRRQPRIASCTRQPVRGVGPQGPARRRDVGGADPGPARARARRRHDRARSSRRSRLGQRPVTIDRPGSSARCATSPWSMPPAASTTPTYLARLRPLREQLDAVSRRSGAEATRRAGARVAARPRRVMAEGRRAGGEGRPAPRHLRPDHGRGAPRSWVSGYTGGLRARIGAGAARKGCYGAPDRIRTCDLRLRRPTLYPLSYRRSAAASYRDGRRTRRG